MNVFTNCPKCNKPLLNEVQVSRHNRQEVWRKSCTGVDHEFCMTVNGDKIEGMILTFDVNERLAAYWSFLGKGKLIIGRGKDVDIYTHGVFLPFFEPDFSNYSALVKKLRTYLTFS